MGKRFSHSLLVGLSKIPRKIIKKQPIDVKISKLKIKVFIKMVNHSHLMLTRYYFTRLDIDLIKSSVFTSPSPTSNTKTSTALQRKIICKKILQNKYRTGQYRWFFKKLRF